MITAAIVTSLQVYAIAIAISILVALLIKAMVSITARLEKARKVDVPLGTVSAGLGLMLCISASSSGRRKQDFVRHPPD